MSLSLPCISHYQWSIMHTRWKLNYSALLKREESNGFQALEITCTMHCSCSVIVSYGLQTFFFYYQSPSLCFYVFIYIFQLKYLVSLDNIRHRVRF